MRMVKRALKNAKKKNSQESINGRLVEKPLVTVWQDTYYVRAFQLAKLGFSNLQIAQALGVRLDRFQKWCRDKPALRDALEVGRDKEDVFLNYVYGRLTPEMQKIWDKINYYRKGGNRGWERIEALLTNHGQQVRQMMFLHALIKFNFNPSKACRATGANYSVFKKWCRDDPGFKGLIDELEWHRGNFYQDALDKLVKKGEPSIVKFVNATFNKDRGYTEKIIMEGQVNHHHQIEVLDGLDLPLEVQKVILEAIEKKKAIDVQSRPLLEDHSQEPIVEDLPPYKVHRTKSFREAQGKENGERLQRHNRLSKEQARSRAESEREERLAAEANGRVYRPRSAG